MAVFTAHHIDHPALARQVILVPWRRTPITACAPCSIASAEIEMNLDAFNLLAKCFHHGADFLRPGATATADDLKAFLPPAPRVVDKVFGRGDG